jgi:polyhydroxyalkanoate synthase
MAQTPLSRIARAARGLVSDFLHRQTQTDKPAAPPDSNSVVARSFAELAGRLVASPGKVAEIQLGFWKDYWALWERTSRRVLGAEVLPVIVPSPTDWRFKDEEWTKNAVFDFIKQSYLLTARSMQRTVTEAPGLDPKTAARVEFYTRQFVDALSPSNSIVLNPAVLKATRESGGENLLRGLANLLEDLEQGKGDLQIRRHGEKAFELGQNLAVTPGKVVFQNDLMQLIQYAPTTETVWKRPLLIVPPWINKFYVLDLSAWNSWVRWAVAAGFTLFVISWVNPDERLAAKGFDDYLSEGPLAALDAIEKATGEREVQAVGYCLGGTLLTCALGYLAARGESRIASSTLFTTMIDFADPGELGVFIDEEQLQTLERGMADKGYLDGATMARAFTAIRANDLIWSFVVHNYLLGKDPLPFDVLYWGADSTRMPAKMHTYYLRTMYQENRLQEPGGVTLLGEAIDLGKVTAPVYFLSAREDYIAPWKSTYAGTRLFGGDVRFVLGGSGHIAAVVNPAGSPLHGYATNDERPHDAAAWLAGAKDHAGSWWPDWLAWATPKAGERVAPRMPGGGALTVIEDAPGAYVRVK